MKSFLVKSLHILLRKWPLLFVTLAVIAQLTSVEMVLLVFIQTTVYFTPPSRSFTLDYANDWRKYSPFAVYWAYFTH